MESSRPWLTLDIWKIAGSAFFADLGYQAILAGFPLFLVLGLKAPVWAYGLAMALSYGPGAAIAVWGGHIGDRLGHRKIAIWGNAFIPLLSFSALIASPISAIGFLTVGWWARNFRTPSRRTMLTERVTDQHRSQAFGFLHGLDVGGGMLAGLYVLLLVALHWPFRWIFLLTVIPLGISTALLIAVPRREAVTKTAKVAEPVKEAPSPNRSAYRGVLMAAALYGFSSYNLGFPILTVAEGVNSAPLGVLAYVLFLGVSALTGFLFGKRSRGTIRELAGRGYFGAAVGSLGLAIAYAFRWPLVGFYLPIIVLGFALGVIETVEPTLISRLMPGAKAGQGMGALTGARSVGLFAANLIMGLLYHLTPVDAYGYATLVAILAGVLLLRAGSGSKSAAVPTG